MSGTVISLGRGQGGDATLSGGTTGGNSGRMWRAGDEAPVVLRFRLFGEPVSSALRARALGDFADCEVLIFCDVPPWLGPFSSLDVAPRVGDRDGETRRLEVRGDFEPRRGAALNPLRLSRRDFSSFVVPEGASIVFIAVGRG